MRIMLVAGEASGDVLAAELMGALQLEAARRLWPWPLEFTGAGGPRMAAAGARLTFDLTAHAVIGIWEVLKNYAKFRQFFRALLERARAEQPDAVVLVDYPGFNLRFARALQASVRSRRGPFHNWKPAVVYYVSPQVWAWHSSRVHQIARDVDLMLTIFPFEKDWYGSRARQLRVEYVGHPLLDRFRHRPAPAARVGSGAEKPVVLLLPGSRRRELRQHLRPMLQAAERIRQRVAVRFLMVLPDEDLSREAAMLMPADLAVERRVGGLAEALQQATMAMASSGTVTLECAFFRVPTVVLYRVAWPTYWLGRLFVHVDHIAMPNLLAQEMVYPEFIQQSAHPDQLAQASLELLENPERRRQIQGKLDRVVASLGEGGASVRAAKILLDFLQARGSSG